MDERIANYYRVLEVKLGASPDEVKQAYRELVKVWHPDRFANDPKLQHKAQEKLKEINLAYKFLVSECAASRQNDQKQAEQEEKKRFLRVGEFLYVGRCCDEIEQHNLKDSHEAKVLLGSGTAQGLAEFAIGRRAVRYFFLPKGVDYGSGVRVLSHLDFEHRAVFFNMERGISLKTAVFPLAMFYLRDMLSLPSNDGQRKRAIKGLHWAKWDGDQMFEGISYLKAEQLFCNKASEHLIQRWFHSKTHGPSWASDVKAAWSEGLDNCAHWFAACLADDRADLDKNICDPESAEGGEALANLSAGEFRALAAGHHNGMQYEKAFKFYLKAATKGDAAAQFHIGCYIDEGRVKSKDGRADAKHWYKMSAQQGYEPAKKKLNVVGNFVRGIIGDWS